jgi:hypothetical protein
VGRPSDSSPVVNTETGLKHALADFAVSKGRCLSELRFSIKKRWVRPGKMLDRLPDHTLFDSGSVTGTVGENGLLRGSVIQVFPKLPKRKLEEDEPARDDQQGEKQKIVTTSAE